MAKGIKTGGRKKGTGNKITTEVRNIIHQLFMKEVNDIDTRLEALSPKARIDVMLKLAPYLAHKIATPTLEKKPKRGGTKDFTLKFD